jgi:Spy/CpxP family protein refolding chaperone
MLRKLLIGLGVFAVTGTFGVVLAAHSGLSRREALGLQKEQVEKLRSVRLAARKDAIRTRSEIRIKRLELRELMQAGTVDRKAIDQKVTELLDLHGKAVRARVEARLQAREILTPEQREKLRDLGPRNRGRRRGQPGEEGGRSGSLDKEGEGPA